MGVDGLVDIIMEVVVGRVSTSNACGASRGTRKYSEAVRFC